MVTSVTNAITGLKARKKTAEALPENAPRRAELIRTIDNAIRDAEAHLDAIKKVKQAQAGGAGSVGLLARKIKAADDGKGTATTWAEKVAQEMEKAATPFIGLATAAGNNKVNLPMNTGGKTKVSTWTDFFREGENGVTASQASRGSGSAIAGATFYDNPKVKFKDDVGGRAKTWKEIVGQNNVIKRAVNAGQIEMVPLEEGMNVGDDLVTQENVNLVGVIYAYQGIAGIAYCLTNGCTVTDGKLGAGWHWAPTDKNKRWKMSTTGDYEEFTDYAEYGYWMGENTDGIVTDTGYFGIPKDETAMPAAALAANTALGNEATYRGKAFGLSIVTEADGTNGRKAVRSGDFTADVTLTAKFGTSPKVEGTISNFQGSAVNSSWRATLEEGPLLNSKVTANAAVNAQNYGLVKVADQDDGRYTARAYGGDANKRPTGITGDFQAFFEDGRALGGYATRKQ